MNFICMLNQLGMTDHYLIAALDEKMYAWGVRQGLPIYPLEHKMAGTKLEGNERKDQAGTSYSTDHVEKTTKLKSKAVLEILEKGYSVVWSDVDVTWFKHPFEALADHMQGYGIAIQSNAPFVSNPEREAASSHGEHGPDQHSGRSATPELRFIRRSEQFSHGVGISTNSRTRSEEQHDGAATF